MAMEYEREHSESVMKEEYMMATARMEKTNEWRSQSKGK